MRRGDYVAAIIASAKAHTHTHKHTDAHPHLNARELHASEVKEANIAQIPCFLAFHFNSHAPLAPRCSLHTAYKCADKLYRYPHCCLHVIKVFSQLGQHSFHRLKAKRE